MLRSFGQIQRVMGPYFASRGISSSQWAVMRTLHRAKTDGQPALRLTDLSERLLIRPPSVTGVIDRLQRDGLVERETQSEDLRVRCVALTAKGQRLVDSVLMGHPEQVKKVLAGLNESELADLLILHEKMTAHLQRLQQVPEKANEKPDENGGKATRQTNARKRRR